MTHIVTCEQLKRLQANDEVTIVDVRFHLQQSHLGKELYDKAHLPGAYFLDIEKDLSGEIEQHGGNHPLPNIDQLRSEEHTSELQSRGHLVCRLLLEIKK